MLSEEVITAIYDRSVKVGDSIDDLLHDVATAAAQAERHRIYAAIEADPGALWRDQGFQEWRRNREVS